MTDLARLPEAATSRLGAISLIVPDYDDAIGFFCKGLGWTLCEDVAQGHKRWVTVQPPGGGCRLVLAQPADPTQKSAIGAQDAAGVKDIVMEAASLFLRDVVDQEEEPEIVGLRLRMQLLLADKPRFCKVTLLLEV